MGWTQHSKGVQIIRTAAILQLLLGNIGRPGGGILALRGHASIQGSTDIPTLYDILPGYLRDAAARARTSDLEEYVGQRRHAARLVVAHRPKYIVVAAEGLVRATRPRAENDYGFGWLPRITGNHSHFSTMLRDMMDGELDGLFVMGQNPAVGSQHAGLERRALGELKWLVVRDLVEIETASFWRDSPEVRVGRDAPEDIGHEVFLMPAAGARREGGRLHQHPAPAAVAGEGGRPAGRRALGAVVHPPPAPCA